MNIYRVFSLSDDYAQLDYKHPKNSYRKTIACFLGLLHHCDETVPKQWNPIPVRLEPDEYFGDFPCLVGRLTLSRETYEILKPVVTKWIELLPLECDNKEYFLVKVPVPTDCLDYSRAEVSRFESGRVHNVRKYAFHKEKIADAPIFRLPSPYQLLVTDVFKDCVERNQLKGLEFKLVASE